MENEKWDASILKKLIARHGSQGKLSDFTGLNMRSLGEWAKGKTTPNRSTRRYLYMLYRGFEDIPDNFIEIPKKDWDALKEAAVFLKKNPNQLAGEIISSYLLLLTAGKMDEEVI